MPHPSRPFALFAAAPLALSAALRPACIAALLFAFFALAGAGSSLAEAPPALAGKLAALEASFGGRLGLAALDAGNGGRIEYRADERFPLCSTFKVMLVGAVLKRSMTDEGLMEKRVDYAGETLVSWSPVTEKHVAEGMTVSELCAATLQYSDNTAANLLLREAGGPEGVTAFARSIGDAVFSLNRREPDLNTAIPGDERDTTSPSAMAESLHRLTLGDALDAARRERLLAWLQGNTTGNESIRAGLPKDWTVGDKTGSGAYGTTNDIAVIQPPSGAPFVLAVYVTQQEKDAPARKDIVREAARLVAEELR